MSADDFKLMNLYQAEVDKGVIQAHPRQEHVLKVLQDCYILNQRSFRLPWQKRHLKSSSVYIYGSIGSGKTYVMDLFYQALPSHKKARFHFHDWFEQLAQELKGLQGQKNPMQRIVQRICQNYKLLCIDEFMVQDVVQAMLLVELIPALIEKKVMLVLTSNIEPAQLYLNGLQRQRFMQVIECLEQNTHVVSLNSSTDFRGLRYPMPQKLYFTDEAEFEDVCRQYFGDQIQIKTMNLQNRSVTCRARRDKMIWFDYSEIACIPRCQRDYLDLAKTYDMVFISGLKAFSRDDVASLVLWIYLIDVLYDAKIKLIIYADCAIDDLYTEGPMLDVFQRSKSRLLEMQSKWYWQE